MIYLLTYAARVWGGDSGLGRVGLKYLFSWLVVFVFVTTLV